VKPRGISLTLIAALVGVVAGSVVLAGIFSGHILSHGDQTLLHNDASDATASRMPLDVKHVFKYREQGADANAHDHFQVYEEFVDDENHCEFCIAVVYEPGPHGRALLAFNSDVALDLRDANNVVFEARGENGGEIINVYAVGARVNESNVNSTGGNSEILKGTTFAIAKQLTLDKDWQRYEIDLNNIDLSSVTHAFAFEVLKGKGNEKQVVYLDSIYYTDNEFNNAVSLN